MVLENTATVSSAGTLDPNPANDTSDTTSTTVEEDVELSVTKTFNSATVTAGGASQTFTLTVTNDGVSDADNVNLSDTVDPRLLVGSVAAGSFDCSASSGQTIDCSLAHLGAGASSSVIVTYSVDTATEAASRRRQHGRRVDPTRMSARPGHRLVDIVEDVVISVTKTLRDR